MSEFFRFHNGLRILLNVGINEFPGPIAEWPRFRDNPWRYFIGCPDEIAVKLWCIIEDRNNAAQRHVEELAR